jgi:predicted ATPase
LRREWEAWESSPADRSGAEQGRFRLFAVVARSLERLAKRQPVLVLLDDLHLADVASLLLLKFIAQDLGSARVLVVVAYSDEALAGPAARVIGALSRVDPSRRLLLGALEPDEVRRLSQSLWGTAPEPSVVDRMLEKSGGNPALLVQILWEQGSDQARARNPNLRTSALLADSAMREAIAVQLHGIEPASLRLLQVAAVIGKTFLEPTLQAATGEAPEAVVRALDEGQRARVLARAGAPGSFRFVHALVRDVLYHDLSLLARRRWHQTVATTLLARASQDLDHRLEAAKHFAAAVPLEPVDTALRAAAEVARAARQARQDGAALEVLERAAEVTALGATSDATALRAAEQELVALRESAPTLKTRVEPALAAIRRARGGSP